MFPHNLFFCVFCIIHFLNTITGQISKSGSRTLPREYNVWWSRGTLSVSTDYMTRRIIEVRPLQVYSHSSFNFCEFNIRNQIICVPHCYKFHQQNTSLYYRSRVSLLTCSQELSPNPLGLASRPHPCSSIKQLSD